MGHEPIYDTPALSDERAFEREHDALDGEALPKLREST